MREQKFKAWNRVTNQMSQPFTLEGIVTSSEIITCYRGIDGELEFLEYIGLKDKNKVEIYDGDIVKSIHNFYYVFGERLGYTKENCDEGNWLIEWSEMGFHGKPISEKCLGSSLTFVGDFPNAEVIGNKWESPELLEKTE